MRDNEAARYGTLCCLGREHWPGFAELEAMPGMVEMDKERLARTYDVGLIFVRTPDRQEAFHRPIDCGTHDAMHLLGRVSAETGPAVWGQANMDLRDPCSLDH